MSTVLRPSPWPDLILELANNLNDHYLLSEILLQYLVWNSNESESQLRPARTSSVLYTY